jgi:muramidase (phage lysozyme)
MDKSTGNLDMASSWNKGELVKEASLKPTSVTQTTLKKVEAQSYDTLYGNFETQDTPFKGTQVSTMTLGELYDFSKPSGEYGKYVKPRLAKSTEAYKRGLTSTPMGKYQIVGTTLRNVAQQMNLPPETVFNKETQDKMFLFLARDAVGRGASAAQKRKNLRGVWEGFKYVDDSTLDKVIAEIGNNG